MRIAVASCLILVGWLPPGAVLDLAAQEEPRVRDLTATPLLRELLIDILRPRGLPPSATRSARSLEDAAPRCDIYRERLGRGLGVAAQSDIAAIEIRFAFNSAELSPAALENLSVLGAALRSPTLSSSCIRVEGHTDSIGSADYNVALSRRRARRVVDHLVASFSLESDRLVATGQGESRPIADNATWAGRAKNRRVEVANLGFGEEAP